MPHPKPNLAWIKNRKIIPHLEKVDAAHLDHQIANSPGRIDKADQQELNARTRKSSEEIRASKAKFRTVLMGIHRETGHLEAKLQEAKAYSDSKRKLGAISDLNRKLGLLKDYSNFLENILNE